MKKLTVALAGFALAAIFALPVQAADTSGPVTCTDGTTSPHGGKGACSKHGGIKKDGAAAETAAPAASAKAEPAKAAPAKTEPAKADSGGAVTCVDGTTSPHGGKGACSKHGGIKKDGAAAKTEAAAPAAASKPAAAAAAPTAASKPAPAAKPVASASAASTATAEHSVNNDATGATAKCKDGSYSHSTTHSGTCSRHGGVAEWLDGTKK
jgi:Protein of unknown function (DUF3761)